MIDLDWLVLFHLIISPQINQLYSELGSADIVSPEKDILELRGLFGVAMFSTFVQPMISKAQQQQHDTINKSSSIFESREYSFFQSLPSLVMMIFIS